MNTITTSAQPEHRGERLRLVNALQAQRDHVVGILEDLDEATARRVIAPSGWNVLGLVQHLTHDDERFWFSAVIAGDPAAIEATLCGGDAWQIAEDQTLAAVLAAYRAETARSTAVLLEADLDAPPAWWPGDLFGDWRLDDVREVVLHVVTETATHAGHLDLVRELMDGRQWIAM